MQTVKCGLSCLLSHQNVHYSFVSDSHLRHTSTRSGMCCLSLPSLPLTHKMAVVEGNTHSEKSEVGWVGGWVGGSKTQ